MTNQACPRHILPNAARPLHRCRGAVQLALVLVALVLGGCAAKTPPLAPGDFQPGPTGAALPWSGQAFDSSPQQLRFAVIGDLTGGERAGIFEVAAQQLALLRPEFIMSVGDLIEGGTDDRAQIEREWTEFDRRVALARAPVFYAGGNHDLNTSLLRDVWARRLGPRYYHFVYRDTLFLVLDSEDHSPQRMQEIAAAREQALQQVRAEGNWSSFSSSAYAQMPENKAGHIGAEQAAYMRAALAANPGVRWTFLFVHKAPWLRNDAVHFQAIEETLRERPYTVFHGHEHVYQQRQRHGRDYIQLATTGGVQFPANGLSADLLTLVTLGEGEPTIVNLRMDGILDKQGVLPGNGAGLCFDISRCNPP
jgi:hypothetical protein